jgi:hypothetical protein
MKNNEKYNQIIDEVYKNYADSHWTPPENPKGPLLSDQLWSLRPMEHSKESFIQECKNNRKFSERWGLKIEERELSLEERLDLAAKTYELFDPFDFGIPGKVDHDEVDKLYPVAKQIITLQYNEEKVEVYE